MFFALVLFGDTGWKMQELFSHQQLTKHLQDTVWSPLNVQHGGKFSTAPSQFAPAPNVTTFRLVGEGASLVERQLDDALPALRSEMTSLVSSGDTATIAVDCLSINGLPECFTVRLLRNIGTAAPAVAAVVVVDPGCGEAVMRGSHVFAPGILASTAAYQEGQVVEIRACVGRNGAPAKMPLKGSLLRSRNSTTVEAVEDEAKEEATPAASPLFDVDVDTIVVGYGTVLMDRSTVVNKGKGVAIQSIAAPHPSQEMLERAVAALGKQLNISSAIAPFLQNFSSMLPAAMLDISHSMTVLDMCAAPGGKSSHVLSRFRSVDAQSRLPGETQPFSLVCCERSGSRAKKLKELLASHHGAQFCSQHVEVFTGDANKYGKTADSGVIAPSFDRILLDPPCTGFGLRPRLQPHPHTLKDVQESADYQRKLFDTAWKHLKPGGLLSYSTCTMSLEENEANVVWAMKQYPDLELCRADTDLRLQLLGLAPQRSYLRAPFVDAGLLGQDEGAEYMVFRFGPQPEGSPFLDSVGFFAALFRKVPEAGRR